MVGSVAAGGASALCALTLALDVACGMSHIHAKNVIHGDLSSANILLTRCSPQPASGVGVSMGGVGMVGMAGVGPAVAGAAAGAAGGTVFGSLADAMAAGRTAAARSLAAQVGGSAVR